MDGTKLGFVSASADIVRLIESKEYQQARKRIESRIVSQADRTQLSRQENDRAVIAVLEGQLIEARNGFRRAIELDSECWTARENLELLDEDVNLSRIASDIAFPKCLVLLITYNRIEYTKHCLEALLDVDYPELEIVIWDNHSTDGTQKYLEEETHGIANLSLHFSNTNDGVVRPMNEVWSSHRSANILAKLDNDTRVPTDWLKRLVPSHLASEKLGVLSGFHFREEGEKIAKKTDIVTVGNRQVLKQMFVGGCAITIRRELFEKFAPIPEARPSQNGPFLDSGWTQFQQRLGDAGYWNGYPWPAVHVDHMEDTRSPFCITTEEHQNYKQQMRGMSLEQFTDKLCVWNPH